MYGTGTQAGSRPPSMPNTTTNKALRTNSITGPVVRKES